MLNFTVGPVQIQENILELGKEQVPYFRTDEFSALMKENEKTILSLFDAPENSRSIFMTGSGTSSMEAGVMNFFTAKDKVLVVNGGSFGERLAELCEIHEIPYTQIKLQSGKPLTEEILGSYENKGYTGFLVQLCETSTGVRYDMNMIGDFCRRNNMFLFVDAVSGFLADEISMKKMNINAAITGSQKALALPPGLSVICMDEKAVERCNTNKVHSLYFNLASYLKNGERGQTPFTPAVSILIQLNSRLKELAKDNGKAEHAKIAERASYFRNIIKELPFTVFTDLSALSNCVTALKVNDEKVSAHRLFEVVKDEYKIWICPNGGELKDKVFRVGHIGNLSLSDYDSLAKALKKALAKLEEN